MANDPAAHPQPDPKNDARRPPADEREGETMDDDKAAKALEKIEEVQRKLEPRG